MFSVVELKVKPEDTIPVLPQLLWEQLKHFVLTEPEQKQKITALIWKLF